MITETTKIWNVTLYLRLSREDGDKEESNSITGQRELLRSYLRQHPELREYAVRIDDGWSGSTFERPSFQKMMADVKAGCRSSVQALATPHSETSSAPKPFSATMQHDGSGSTYA